MPFLGVIIIAQSRIVARALGFRQRVCRALGFKQRVCGVIGVIAHGAKPPALQRCQSSGLKTQVAAVESVVD